MEVLDQSAWEARLVLVIIAGSRRHANHPHHRHHPRRYEDRGIHKIREYSTVIVTLSTLRALHDILLTVQK